MIAVYPGSFDPITYGHIDIIERSSKKFEKIIVSVLNNPAKKPMFSVNERVKFIEEATKHLDNVIVDSFSGLLIDYVKQNDISIIVKGLRSTTDFEYELQMALTNKCLDQNIETVFLMTSSNYIYLSSSLVKDVVKFNGDVSKFVPPVVREAVIRKIKGV